MDGPGVASWGKLCAQGPIRPLRGQERLASILGTALL